MPPSIISCAFGAALVGLSVAQAAPTVQIRGAAARVVVIPGARRDIAVVVVHTARGLPLKIRRSGQQVIITGTVARRIRGCVVAGGRSSIRIWSRGETAVASLPEVVIRTPMDVRISAGDAVFGAIGRSTSLDLTNQGCGAWTVADVATRMRVDQAGSGTTRTGTAQSADLSVAGSGVLNTQAIAGGVTAVSSGDGEIRIASSKGPLDVRIAGAGAIRFGAGETASMKASIAGSGDIVFAGEVKDLDAMIAGSGHVRVARVAGAVTKRLFGVGSVVIGP